jgi:hypothetical protein
MLENVSRSTCGLLVLLGGCGVSERLQPGTDIGVTDAGPAARDTGMAAADVPPRPAGPHV